MIVPLVFVGLVLIPFTVMSLILLVALSVGPRCPACYREAALVQRPPILRRVRWLERRWCLDCGWQGYLRRGQDVRVDSSAVETGPKGPARAEERG